MRKIIFAAAALSATLAGSAQAASVTGNMNVTATVAASCTNVTTTDLAFGSVGQNATNIDNTGTVSFTCTNTTPWFVTAALGTNVTGTQNRMKHATLAQFINYNIYSDSARTTAFPTTVGTLGSGNTGGTGSGVGQTVTIYGRIPSGQALPSPGSYSDVVQLTVNY